MRGRPNRRRGVLLDLGGHTISGIGAVFRYALRENLVATNPCSLLERGDIRTADDAEQPSAYEWSDNEIDALLTASERVAEEPTSRADYSRLLRLTVATGLRLGEVLGLQWEDVDREAGVLNVKRQLDRTGQLAPLKTKKSRRRVPLTADATTVLNEQREILFKIRGSAALPGFVFPSKSGGALSHRNVQRRGFHRAREKAGLPEHVTFHDLRHAFASRAASRGVPVNVLSEILGHSHVGVTQQVYLHLYGRDAAEEAFRAAMDG